MGYFGVGESAVHAVALVSLIAVVLVLAWIADRIALRILVPLARKLTERTKATWDDILFNERAVRAACHLAPAIVVWVLMPKMCFDHPVTQSWIARFTAIYFITERTVSPLKQMSRATKQFANGKFDVRIPVNGNDEIAELATAFNTMAESLSKQEYMRSTFLANVSHDLRTPMTTISGFIDGILDGAIPPEKQDYYLGIIAQEVRRLSRLVSSLLDISRIQAGDRKFEKADFDICEMARLILLSFELTNRWHLD